MTHDKAEYLDRIFTYYDAEVIHPAIEKQLLTKQSEHKKLLLEISRLEQTLKRAKTALTHIKDIENK